MKDAFRVVALGPGGPEVFRTEPFRPGEPGPGQVLLRHEWVGVNWVDTQHRAGTPFSVPFPAVLGVEASGVVEAVGPGVALKNGERVAYAGIMPGAYASHTVADAARLVRLPDGLDPQLAAAGLMQGATALMLSRYVIRANPGDRVLVHAAAGGVGSLLVQDLVSLGATVHGTVSRESKVPAVREDGATEVFVVSDDAAWEQRWTALAKAGALYRAVADGVGGSRPRGGLRLLQARGVYALYGVSAGVPELLQPNDLSGITGAGPRGSLWLTWPTLNDYLAETDDYQALMSATLEALKASTLRPRAFELPLEEAAKAHRLLESRQMSGKIILRV